MDLFYTKTSMVIPNRRKNMLEMFSHLRILCSALLVLIAFVNTCDAASYAVCPRLSGKQYVKYSESEIIKTRSGKPKTTKKTSYGRMTHGELWHKAVPDNLPVGSRAYRIAFRQFQQTIHLVKFYEVGEEGN